MRDPILEELFSRRGATKRVAQAVGITSAAVSQWKKVPADKVDAVAAALGVSKDELPVSGQDIAA